VTLDSSVGQRYLGVSVLRSLTAEGHVSRVVKKAYGTFGFINLGTDYNSKEVVLKLHRTAVRPQIEYCALVTTLSEGSDCTAGGAEEIHRDAAWGGTF